MDVKIGQVYKRPQDTTWKMVFMISGNYVATMSLMKTNKFWKAIDASLGDFGWPNPTKVENFHKDSIGVLMGTVTVRDYRKVMNVVHDFTMGRITFVPHVGYVYIDEIDDYVVQNDENKKDSKEEATKTTTTPNTNVNEIQKEEQESKETDEDTAENASEIEEVVEENVEEPPAEKSKETEEDRINREKEYASMLPTIDLIEYYNKYCIEHSSSGENSNKKKSKCGRKAKTQSIAGKRFTHDEIINISLMSSNAIKEVYDISYNIASCIKMAALDILGMRDTVGQRVNWKKIFDGCDSYNMEEEIASLAKEYQTTTSFVKKRYSDYLNSREGLQTFNQFYPILKESLTGKGLKDIASIEDSTAEDISKVYNVSISCANAIKRSLRNDYLNKEPLFLVFGKDAFDDVAFAQYIEDARLSNNRSLKAIFDVFQRVLNVRNKYIETYSDHGAILAKKKDAPSFSSEEEASDYMLLIKHRFNMSTSYSYLTDDEKVWILETRSNIDIAKKVSDYFGFCSCNEKYNQIHS